MNLEHTLKDILETELPGCRFMEPMSRHTSFRIGGPAEIFISPSGEEELAAVLRVLGTYHVPWRILGNGSNLLVSDSGCEGAVIAMEGISHMEACHSILRVGGGQLLGRAAHLALEHSLTGMEFAAGIPAAQAAHWS